MVLVSTDTFLAKVAALSTTPAKGSVVVSCKSVPVAKVNGKPLQQILELTVEDGDDVMLYRVCKHGNNQHKNKYSTVVTSRNHAVFHASLGQIITTKDNACAKDLIGTRTKRVVAKVKKTAD